MHIFFHTITIEIYSVRMLHKQILINNLKFSRRIASLGTIFNDIAYYTDYVYTEHLRNFYSH